VRKPLSLTFTVDDADPTTVTRACIPPTWWTRSTPCMCRATAWACTSTRGRKERHGCERKLIENLGRAGKRLMGFCRTNLFKRLESSGFSFLQSIDRHILRNQIYLYAIENGLDLPVGVLDAGLLDLERVDEDAEGLEGDPEDLLDGLVDAVPKKTVCPMRHGPRQGRVPAVRHRIQKALQVDTPQICSKPSWRKTWRKTPGTCASCCAARALGPRRHRPQAAALHKLLTQTHGKDKVLIFTQFADTARYLAREARKAGITHVAVATGASADPLRWPAASRPKSNNKT
jgi:hypothetical protein